MDLNDDRWAKLDGGYRVQYDPRPMLACLAEPLVRQQAWETLWQELHHQGDVGAASYASVIEIARNGLTGQIDDWNGYALAATVELCRVRGNNPDVPEWLSNEYKAAWMQLFEAALGALPTAQDESLVSSIFAVLAIQKDHPNLSRLSLLTKVERKELLDEVSWG